MKEKKNAKKKHSILLYTTAYTSGVALLSYEEKGRLFDEIMYQAGSVHAKKPELSPVIEMAACGFVDAMKENAVKYEAVCEQRRLAGSTGGQAKAKNRTSRNVANVANLPNVANSTYEYEYEYEYDKTHSPDKEKNNILSDTITSIDTEPNLAELSKCYTELSLVDGATLHEQEDRSDNDPPDDYDPHSLDWGTGLNGEDFDSPF